MIVIPAIDLKQGQCVRLLQGKKEEVTVYSNSPAETARLWESCGAKLLHVVDLDGAFTGSQKNLDAIIEIRKAVSLDIEVGGGIRDIKKIDKLINIGVNRIILGTAVIENPDLFKEACKKYYGKILVGIDARNGKAAVKGWVEDTDFDAKKLARDSENSGAAGIIYTDISRDGMLTGPNIKAMLEMVDNVQIPVIASGGVSSLEDIKNLKQIKNLWGVIVGKAIYSGAVDLKEAIKIGAEGGI
ncbi:MAG: 1-(5-phosphoribosyl)-5-[(5-phosphoribosylamino)methylideneamino]imidazole-4-carboxamide isomerase [Nitrospiraceae bacterium]|nr:1-(5-phosphoribosyl)-5-[(5-phosphoribosylamino)methylideneamino]imidazole-4-carboxamide isomerase [Nitrospiraceae bacterium]